MNQEIKVTNSRRKYASLCTALALTLSLSTGEILAAQTNGSGPAKNDQLQQQSTHSIGWADPFVALKVERNSQALIDVLKRTDQVLTINDGGAPLAESNLEYATKVANGIEQEMPYVEITDQLMNAKGKLEEGANHEFVKQLAPVYTRIDNLALVSPEMAGKVKQGVKQAESSAKSGNRQKAMDQVDNMVNDFVVTRTYMPILYVKEQLGQARKDISKRDMAGAKQSVERALGSLVEVSTGAISSAELTTYTSPGGQA